MKNLLPIALILGFVGCQSAPEAPAPTPEPPAVGSPSLTSFDARIDEVLAQLSLAEKVGQMTQPANTYLAADSDVASLSLGSVLSGGGQDPEAGNSFEAWRDMVARYNDQSVSSKSGIPLLYGIDSVHGHNNVLGAVIFPHNIGLGATRDADLVERVYRATAIETRATGINWSFAPAVSVPQDIRWGRTYEGFSEDPAVVAELGGAAVRGLQGEGLGDPTGVLACAKHYVGDGGTTFGTGAPKDDMPESVFADEGGMPETEQSRWPLDRGDVRGDDAKLKAIHMPGYPVAIAEGVGSIMPSFSSWNGTKMSGHKELLTDVLKGELGFEGFLISDWAAVNDLDPDYRTAIGISINAGMDMVMVPDKYQEFIENLISLVEAGEVPMSRIDDAVRRILRVKFAMGMMDPGYSSAADPALAEKFGSAEHRELGRRAVQQSLVLLQNDGVLPLSKDVQRVHVVGRNADDIGNQSGGWTIEWQGARGEITEGTTVLEAIRQTVSAETEVTFSVDGSGAEGADVVIAVVGETPYAEMMGDRENLDLDPADQAAIAMAAKDGAPVVTVLISGRPMILGPAVGSSNALVAAWLPGTEGQGVADILFGDAKPSGKLPVTWPRSNDQLPQTALKEGETPLFAFGHGLTY